MNSLVKQLGYKNIFYHEKYDATGTKRRGWQTNGKTRPVILKGLKVAVEDRLMGVNDSEFLAECQAFVDSGSGRFEARHGEHDDRVIGWAIAWEIRNSVPRRGGVRIRFVGDESAQQQTRNAPDDEDNADND